MKARTKSSIPTSAAATAVSGAAVLVDGPTLEVELFGSRPPPVGWLDSLVEDRRIPFYEISGFLWFSVEEVRDALARNCRVEVGEFGPKLSRKRGRPTSFDVSDLLCLIGGGGVKWSQIIAAAGKCKVSKSTAKRVLRSGIDRGLIKRVGGRYYPPPLTAPALGPKH